jgi:ferredoxin-NADP reductase
MTSLKLITKRPEAGNITTFVFESSGETWIAGQSQGWSLPKIGGSADENEHWFTISSAPSEGTMNISTRVSDSVYKQTLNALEPGETIDVQGLGGDFTWEEDISEPVVLVAGGIGITPYRSILIERETQGKQLSATLLYYNRTGNIAFESLFRRMANEHPEFTFVPIVGEKVTGSSIMKHMNDAVNRTVFVSGPEPMVTSVGDDLQARGISIRQDWFPGYNEQTY